MSEDDFLPGEWNGVRFVQTGYGRLEGSGDSENTWSWRGIPYASPPVADLRWKAPRPPRSWVGIRKAKRFGRGCVQPVPVIGRAGSEDCLYLNVWRPKSEERMLPVYVFVHGGGNSIGRSSMADYHGYAVAARSNMVYVSLNYRLSVFGWFLSPAPAEGESPLDASGNFATLDIIAALRWIKENITAFGGDPSNVTLSGESAGAFNVLSLLVSRYAAGLFHRAVIESGIAVMQSRERAEDAALRMTLKLLVRRRKAKDLPSAEALLSTMSKAQTRDFLYSVSASDLVLSLDKSPIGLGMADWPTIYADGLVLPSDGYRAFANGTYANKVPIIIGSNKDENKLFMSFMKAYKNDRSVYDSVAAYRTAQWRYTGVDYVARSITSRHGHPPVYSYRFDWGSPNARGESPMPRNLGSRLGAFHSVEIPFFLGTGKSSVSLLTGRFFTKANAPGRRHLTDAVMRYLAAFARTGNPNTASGEPLPEWKPWDPAPGGFKALVMDVDGAEPKFSILHDSPSLESIKAGAASLPGGRDELGLIEDFAE